LLRDCATLEDKANKLEDDIDFEKSVNGQRQNELNLKYREIIALENKLSEATEIIKNFQKEYDKTGYFLDWFENVWKRAEKFFGGNKMIRKKLADKIDTIISISILFGLMLLASVLEKIL